MKRIIMSLAVVAGTVSVIVIGSTGAFFSDTEKSTGNTFAAGAIDLKIDNSSYYNGVLNASTTWSLNDLTIQKFFDFPDLKPGDQGEDTISLHINNNDAYMCANVKLTSNDDNTQTGPEALVDANGTTTGELASEVNFIWWADDGDNVLESTEHVISLGPIGKLGLNGSTTIALADSLSNIWTGVPGPMPGSETLHIGKAWCFGTIAPAPLSQDDLGTTSPRTPANSTGGISCDGSKLGNETQTDSLTADVSFSATQARNNPGYMCVPPQDKTAKITVVKYIINDNGGNNAIPDFHLFLDDGQVSTLVTSGNTTTVPAGNYNVSETGVSGYVATFSGDCDSEGNITVAPGDNKTCTITNNDLPGNITLIKHVINDNGGTAVPTIFKMRIDGVLVPNNTSLPFSANSPHVINEDTRTGYHFVSITGTGCPANLGGTVTLNEGESVTCTITNDDN